MSDNNVSKLVYSDRPGVVNTVGLSRSKQKLEKVKIKHPNIEIFQCDISKQIECENLTNWIQEKHPECNILINNAAIVHISDFYKDKRILMTSNQKNLI